MLLYDDACFPSKIPINIDHKKNELVRECSETVDTSDIKQMLKVPDSSFEQQANRNKRFSLTCAAGVKYSFERRFG